MNSHFPLVGLQGKLRIKRVTTSLVIEFLFEQRTWWKTKLLFETPAEV